MRTLRSPQSHLRANSMSSFSTSGMGFWTEPGPGVSFLARTLCRCGDGLSSFGALQAASTEGLSSTVQGWRHRPQRAAGTRDPLGIGSWVNSPPAPEGSRSRSSPAVSDSVVGEPRLLSRGQQHLKTLRGHVDPFSPTIVQPRAGSIWTSLAIKNADVVLIHQAPR